MFKEIRDRLEKITQGEWRQGLLNSEIMSGVGPKEKVIGQILKGHYTDSSNHNANFVVHSPSDISTLLQFADEAMELIKDCKTLVNETYGNSPRFDDFLKRWEGK
jgi:hypothetical protein